MQHCIIAINNSSRDHQHHQAKVIQTVGIAIHVVPYHLLLHTIHHSNNVRLYLHHLPMLLNIDPVHHHHHHLHQQQHPTRQRITVRVELLLNSTMPSTMSTRSRTDSATIPRHTSNFSRFFRRIKRNKSPFRKSMPKYKHCLMEPRICWLNSSNSYPIRHNKHPLLSPAPPTAAAVPALISKRPTRNNELCLFHPNKKRPNCSTTA